MIAFKNRTVTSDQGLSQSCGVRMGQQETGEKRGEVQGRECRKLVMLLSVTYHGQHALPT